MADRSDVRDLIRPLAIMAQEMTMHTETVDAISPIPDIPEHVWDLTPEGVRLASDLARMSEPAMVRLMDWVGDGSTPDDKRLIEEALDAVVLAHYAFCAMTRQTVERPGSVEWVLKALSESLRRVYNDAQRVDPVA